MYSQSQHNEFANKVESILPGVTVVRIGYSGGSCSPEAYFEYVRLLGYILDREDEAEELIDWYDRYMDKIKAQTEGLSDDKKPKVFYTFPTYFPTPYYTVNRLHPIHQMIVDAGGINIAVDLGVGGKGFPTIDPEWVLEQDPEIIVGSLFGKSGYGHTEAEMVDLRDIIMLHPGWSHIAAVKSDRVYMISPRLSSTTHQPMGTAYMAKCFYPDLFEDFDPQAIHQEYIDRFCHIDFNVYEDGVFVYPHFK